MCNNIIRMHILFQSVAHAIIQCHIIMIVIAAILNHLAINIKSMLLTLIACLNPLLLA